MDLEPTELAASDRRKAQRYATVDLELDAARRLVADPPDCLRSEAEQDARGHERTQAVASLATALAEAVLAGDHDRARAHAKELQELQER